MMRSTLGVIGLQWGDEGKGKIVHRLSRDFSYVVRFNGGNNAGHTIVQNGQSFVFHILPSGILHPSVIGIIGDGTVIDPSILWNEIQEANRLTDSVQNRLFISENAHVIFPWHIEMDIILEKQRSCKIGTTKRGIGPVYGDKIYRTGIRMRSMLQPVTFLKELKEAISEKEAFLNQISQEPVHFDAKKIIDDYMFYAEKLHPMIKDTGSVLREALRKEKSILLEGAQGTLLDINYGSYPYVTSSPTTIGGATTGAGIPPSSIHDVLGIVKAYVTRVGEGPFPTEQKNELGEKLAQEGHEFGATTGRPRRCGWLDLPALQYAIDINGITSLALMKLDVLDSFSEIAICTEYKNGFSPAFTETELIYQTFPGWNQPTRHCKTWSELPPKAQNYIQFIEDAIHCPINIISVGPGEKETILK
ncbi:MAG: adenylosuccinate synthase [Caldisericia bacterium]|nr:adenylosuccinate synthase [Caldisericia bacterium]MDD4614377.1 adenylosuccinate synthase [Caldisericia bacterium]